MEEDWHRVERKWEMELRRKGVVDGGERKNKQTRKPNWDLEN